MGPTMRSMKQHETRTLSVIDGSTKPTNRTIGKSFYYLSINIQCEESRDTLIAQISRGPTGNIPLNSAAMTSRLSVISTIQQEANSSMKTLSSMSTDFNNLSHFFFVSSGAFSCKSNTSSGEADIRPLKGLKSKQQSRNRTPYESWGYRNPPTGGSTF